MNETTPPRIKLVGVTKKFGFGDAEFNALDGVDLTVKKGEFIAIMGPSGCGKTTLLNIIGLLDQPSSGEYYLDDKSVNNLSSRQRAKVRSSNIGFVFQNFNLVPRLSVLDNVALPLTYKGMRKLKRIQEASRILKTFHLSEREYYMPHQLSGGERQRVAIARAVVRQPKILIADEPTGNLDPKHSWEIVRLLEKINKYGTTVLLTTHNVEIVNRLKRRVITIDHGKITSDQAKGSYKQG